MNINSNSLYGTSLGATYGSSTSSSRSLVSQFAEALLTSMDSDSSGSVDSAEFSSAALELSSSSDESAINNAFKALDSNGDGKISTDEFTSALSAEATAANGSMPPLPSSSSRSKEDKGYTKDELTAMANETSSTDSNLASLLSSVVENFSAADANGDGKVTSAEAMAYQRSSQEMSSGTTDASNIAASGSMPPPPPPPSSSNEEDTGYTKDELTAMASSTSSTDSKLASLFETLAQNFDDADTNSDGKVTSDEARAYKDTTKAESMGVASTATSKTDDNTLMKALLAQIISNYATQNTLSSSSVSFSA